MAVVVQVGCSVNADARESPATRPLVVASNAGSGSPAVTCLSLAVIVSGARATVIVTGCPNDAPSALNAATQTVKLPGRVGVPASLPVAGSSAIPGASTPPSRWIAGAGVPEPASTCENGAP